MKWWGWLLILLSVFVVIAVIICIVIVIVHGQSTNGKDAQICPNNPINYPTNISALSGDGSNISVHWDPTINVDGYNVYVDKTPNFTPSPKSFSVSSYSNTKSRATVGPFPIGTYYVKVAGYSGNCLSYGQPSNGIEITLTSKVTSQDVQIYLNNSEYNNFGSKCQYASSGWFISSTENPCVGATGNRIDFIQSSSNDNHIFTIQGFTNTYIKSKSDPSKCIVAGTVGGFNHPCLADCSSVPENKKRWTYDPSNGTIALFDGSAYLYGLLYNSSSYTNPYGPYVSEINPINPSPNCLPNSNCTFGDRCIYEPLNDNLRSFVWKIVNVQV